MRAGGVRGVINLICWVLLIELHCVMFITADMYHFHMPFVSLFTAQCHSKFHTASSYGHQSVTTVKNRKLIKFYLPPPRFTYQ
jgi:hypothetical protein